MSLQIKCKTHKEKLSLVLQDKSVLAAEQLGHKAMHALMVHAMKQGLNTVWYSLKIWSIWSVWTQAYHLLRRSRAKFMYTQAWSAGNANVTQTRKWAAVAVSSSNFSNPPVSSEKRVYCTLNAGPMRGTANMLEHNTNLSCLVCPFTLCAKRYNKQICIYIYE